MVCSGHRPVSEGYCQGLVRIVKGAVPSYSSPVVVKTNSQGGVKVPTGGNRILVFSNVRSPRALLVILARGNQEDSRLGEIPGPTVKVWL